MRTIVQFIVALFFVSTCVMNEAGAKESSSGITLPERGVCAHRGAMTTHPENTLPAFQEAIRLGVHMIEFDVRLSKDGHLVILHDTSVDRTTDGTGDVSQLTLEELRQLDAGIKKDEQYKGTRIPTLTETLRIMPENVWLNVHLKGGEELGAKVAETIVRENRLRQSFLACGAATAQGARKVHPEIKICNMDRQQNSMDYANRTIESGAQFIQLLGKGAVESDVISKLKKHGIRINYYGTDSSEILCKLLTAGVEFPLVNDPGPMVNTAQEKLGIEPLKPVFRGE